MIEARAQREAELLQLTKAERAKLVRIYEGTTGKQASAGSPGMVTCLAMVREIVDTELPLNGGAE